MDVQVPTAKSLPEKHITFPATDRLMIGFWGFLSLVSLAMHSRLQLWWAVVAANIAAAGLVWLLVWSSQTSHSKIPKWLHDWAPFPLVLFTYKQTYFLIRPLHNGKDYDALLIALDRFLFRVDPTEWMAHFAHPALTELLQIAYSLFYALFLLVGIELYRNKTLNHFRNFSFTVVYGFFISYIGYFFLPAVGPRFSLYDFSRINIELPGLLCTPALRLFVNFFESIPAGVSNSVALACAQRDVFPSGHTMMTLIVIVFACRCQIRLRRFVLVVGTLLIIATVYLRYHYVVDILAGVILAAVCLSTAGRIRRLLGEN